MSIKLKLFPYKLGSASAKKLAEALAIKRLRANGNYYHYASHIVINWGNSVRPSWWHRERKILNEPLSVAIATNKLKCFQHLAAAGVSIPEFTTERSVAKEWLNDEKVVVARATLTGHSGTGITIYDSFSNDDIDSLEGAPLYTKHVRHKREFRVHVFNGVIIDVTEKKKSSSHENPDNFVRSHLKGWKFCREGITVPQDVKDQALDAVNALNLDFGAVDIGYREREDKAYIFEVNTAPGLEGTTLTKYVEAFNVYVSSRG